MCTDFADIFAGGLAATVNDAYGVLLYTSVAGGREAMVNDAHDILLCIQGSEPDYLQV